MTSSNGNGFGITIPGYRVLHRVGAGGMGSVYQAEQLSMQRVVALKLFNGPHHLNPEESVASRRFVREAHTAGRLQSPYVIAVYDAGVHQNQRYLGMEWVDGGDAQQAAKNAGGRLPPQRALAIIRDAAMGLVAIESAQLIHRDVKPANILLAQSSSGEMAKLADLGLSRGLDLDDRMTHTGAIMGTPAFMSPEQAEGVADLDIRSDIYSLGASLFALICGRAPFIGGSPWATVAAVLKDPLPDPKQFGCPAEIAELIEHCMVKDRSLRPANPGIVVSLLNDVLGRLADSPAMVIAHPPLPSQPPCINQQQLNSGFAVSPRLILPRCSDQRQRGKRSTTAGPPRSARG
ncbi:MAG: serine/threonine protein kinase [Planctomycetota bacterium]|nr:MAG: serine/threonine protein kinase [Planctomycetota bacterium]